MTEQEKKEYELALKTGERRYGLLCQHEKTKNGFCVNCKRKIITK